MKYPGICQEKINEKIIKTFNELRDLFQAKNSDYGGSIYCTDPLCSDMDPTKSVLLRLNDKINRLASLLSNKRYKVSSESFTDTLRDLAVYAIILSCMMEYEGTVGIIHCPYIPGDENLPDLRDYILGENWRDKVPEKDYEKHLIPENDISKRMLDEANRLRRAAAEMSRGSK